MASPPRSRDEAEPSSPTPAGELCGWGRVPCVPGRELFAEKLTDLPLLSLYRGLGRSYGDASLPAESGLVVGNCCAADRILEMDPAGRRVRVEAGVSVGQLSTICLPLGLFPPVVPGTQWVTVAGMVASDVHGKNHHRAGTIGRWIRALKLRRVDGRVVDCSPDKEPELFWTTVGGMGLTGLILEVELELESIPSPWILEDRQGFSTLEDGLDRLRASAHSWPFTVVWLDLLAAGRSFGSGVLIRGRWATADEAPSRLPTPTKSRRLPMPPRSTALVRRFNRVYRWRKGRPFCGISSPEGFFFPLDSVVDWHRFYRRGFIQYQCVLPSSEASAGRALVEELRRLGGESYLTVVKDCGAEGRGTLSFPRPGLTFTFDLPHLGAATCELVAGLNAFVANCGGRIYLAKDALTTREDFLRMETRVPDFERSRRRFDPDRRLASALSRRLLDGQVLE